MQDGSMNDLFLSDSRKYIKTWPSKTIRAVIFGYEIHVVELEAYVRVQGHGHSVKFFSFDYSQHMLTGINKVSVSVGLIIKLCNF